MTQDYDANWHLHFVWWAKLEIMYGGQRRVFFQLITRRRVSSPVLHDTRRKAWIYAEPGDVTLGTKHWSR